MSNRRRTSSTAPSRSSTPPLCSRAGPGALAAAAPIATRQRFSASATLPDLRRHGATVLTYTGKVLNYILSVPEAPDDAEVPLRLALGNEASLSDIKAFARRFGCAVRDSYGSTEGMIIIRRDPSMPDGALGSAADTVKVIDPDTMRECPPLAVGADGRSTNLEEAVGEIVETAPSTGFEGYYKNPVATSTRFRNGWYWSGDLGYRDDDGWFYFAGRSNEWLRVDGENFAAGSGRGDRRRVTPLSDRSRSTPCPTTRSATASWWRSNSTRARPSTRRPSTGFSRPNRTSDRSGSRPSCGRRPSFRSWPV